MNNETINNLTLSAIEELKALPIKHKSRVVQKNLVLWEQELFPLLEDVGMPIYQFLLVKILKPAGFEVPDEDDKEAFEKASDNLCTTVNRVRKRMVKKGLLAPSRGAVAVSLPAGGAVPGVVVQPVGSVVSVAQSNPSLGSVPSVQPVKAHIVPVESSGLAPSMYGFNIPDYVVRESSLVAIEDFDMYPDELNRLKREKDDGFNVAWSGVDENIFKEFVPKLLESSKLEISDKNKLDFNSYLPTYLKKVFKGIDEVKLELYKHILMKLKVQKR